MTERIEPIRKEIVVECPQERAFRVFTQKLDTWWPREHNIGLVEMQAALLEERVGGRVYERGIDGSECSWGKVLVWDPPRKLVWTWQITAEWKYDPDFVTEVEVTFQAEGPQRTRVMLEHRDLERYGEAAEAIRKTLDSGWGGTLALFAKASAT